MDLLIRLPQLNREGCLLGFSWAGLVMVQQAGGPIKEHRHAFPVTGRFI